MCFSANASFGAGIILTVIGIAALKKVKHQSQFYFAAIPIIFAFQQITEGFLWLSFGHEDYAFLKMPTTYIFFCIAQLIWPIWVPLAIYKLEKGQGRKKPLRVLLGLGIVLSAYLAFCLLSFDVNAEVVGHHIAYLNNYPDALIPACGAIYIICTIAPPVFSSIKNLWVLALTILVSYIVTMVSYEEYIISVWCYFASIISVLVFLFMTYINAKSPRNFFRGLSMP
jgi:hypothetical protein